MTATAELGLAAPTIKGRLRRRPPAPLLRARSILYGIVFLVLTAVAGALLVAVLFRVSAAGLGDLPDHPGGLILLWPGYVVAAAGYFATRGFRDRHMWAFLIAVAVGLILVLGGAYIIANASNAPAGVKVDGNAVFLQDTIGGFFIVLGVPLLWSLFRGRAWFFDKEDRHPIKTAEAIEAETGGVGPITESLATVLATEVVRAPQEPLVSVRGLKKHFPILGGFLRRQIGTIYAVDGVDFDIFPGEVFSVVGESGCGKTTLGRTLLQLTPPTAGHVIYDGYELSDVDPDDMRPLRRKMQIIFQDPFGSLNPRMPVSDIIGEGLFAQGVTNRGERDKRVEDSLEIVGLRRDYTRRYPHEFSGGQRQRIGIARALALNPDFIVCDEPVSALDVSIQSQVLNLLLDLKRDFNLTYLFISHNLSVVEYFSDRIAVMYLGKVVEIGTVDELYRNARHPYTVALLSAIPIADPRKRRKRLVLKGDVPSPAAPPSGCRFHTRCWLREQLGNPERCVTEDPELRVLDETGHRAACHFSEDINESVVQQTVATQDVLETAVAGE
jgi:oligopeptide/dipeptide ABC transporter ATP-binding protein